MGFRCFFEGGSSSQEFEKFWNQVEKDISGFDGLIDSWQVKSEEKDAQLLISAVELLSTLRNALSQASGFVSCLGAQDMTDTKAREWEAALTTGYAALENVLTKMDEKLVQLDESFFQNLLNTEPLNELSYILTERRDPGEE